MNFNIKEHLPENFSDNSKVWIYQSSRLFSMNEALQMEVDLKNFVDNWQSHGSKVNGFANLFFGRFLIFMADESSVGVSGCSTDSSVRLVKKVEKDFNVEMFDRQLLAFYIKNKVEIIPLSQLDYAIKNNILNEGSLFFNNTVLTKKELEDKWIAPLADSWLKKMFQHS